MNILAAGGHTFLLFTLQNGYQALSVGSRPIPKHIYIYISTPHINNHSSGFLRIDIWSFHRRLGLQTSEISLKYRRLMKTVFSLIAENRAPGSGIILLCLHTDSRGIACHSQHLGLYGCTTWAKDSDSTCPHVFVKRADTALVILKDSEDSVLVSCVETAATRYIKMVPCIFVVTALFVRMPDNFNDRKSVVVFVGAHGTVDEQLNTTP